MASPACAAGVGPQTPEPENGGVNWRGFLGALGLPTPGRVGWAGCSCVPGAGLEIRTTSAAGPVTSEDSSAFAELPITEEIVKS